MPQCCNSVINTEWHAYMKTVIIGRTWKLSLWFPLEWLWQTLENCLAKNKCKLGFVCSSFAVQVCDLFSTNLILVNKSWGLPNGFFPPPGNKMQQQNQGDQISKNNCCIHCFRCWAWYSCACPHIHKLHSCNNYNKHVYANFAQEKI